MTRPSRSVVSQLCPNCGRAHDVSIYVSGQQATCACGIRFEVRRTDVRRSQGAMDAGPSTLNERPLPDVRPTIHAAGGGASSGPPAEPAEPLPESEPPPQELSQVERATRLPARLEIPGYQLVELLGRGGMGEVWRARQISLNRMVAVKVLPDKFASDTEFVSRFDKEATALASLSHPNIVQIIDRGFSGANYYFAMELVPGINLREMLGAQKLSVRDVLRIGVQVAQAIDYAHEKHIVHRDLKPENILVDARGHVKIADFGLAGMHGSEHNISLTATSVAMGTVNYMAPEQRRDAKHVDHRADLYSLGVLLYEMLTGELPIGRFKLPSERVPALDPRIDPVVAKLLESEPEHRPRRGSEVAEALEALMPVSEAHPVLPGTTPSPPSPSDQLATAAMPTAAWRTGALVLGGVLLFVAALRFWPAPTSPPVVAARPSWYADTDGELFSAALVSGAELKLDFEPKSDGEEINAHCGVWRLSEGALVAVQHGDSTDLEEHPKIVPRAYVAHRYYSTDDFDAEALMDVEALGAEFPPLSETDQRYAELAFRIKDLQVSIFAIPTAGMRLMWRYFTPEGREVVGNSALDLANMVEDEMRVPQGRFKVRLKLSRYKNGATDVEAFVNDQRFYHKRLEGLMGRVGKVTLGCRNLSCRFDDLSVRGAPMPKPKLRDAQ